MPHLPPDILATAAPPEGAVYGLGTFDGVHKGHLHLIDEVLRVGREQGLPAWILVLYRDPTNPLFAGQQVITTRRERNLIFSETALDGASTLRLVPEVTNLAHDAFVRDVLCDQLRARHLVVGWDFHYGHARVGNVSLLREQLAQSAPTCGLTMLDPVMDGPEPIKSTTIREWLLAGELAQANRWLTRPYFMLGEVVTGQQLGRQLGFPTANLALAADKLRPAQGVYITRAEVAGQQHWAATNVGQRPTVAETEALPSVEAHLLDFAGDLYGAEFNLQFHQFLRPERKFPSLEALKEQLSRDIAAVRDYAAMVSLPD